MKRIRMPSVKENTPWLFKVVVAGAIATAAQIPAAVVTLMAFMAMDMVTGLIRAYATHTISSDASRKGISKKLLTLILLYAIHQLEKLSGYELGIEKIAAVAYTINEAISITENCSRCGVPIPEELISFLMRFKKLNFAKQEATGKFLAVDEDALPRPTEK